VPATALQIDVADSSRFAVSRQVAALERTAGARLFDRRPDGVRLTPAGRTLLAHAAVVLDEVDAAERELTGLAELSEQSWIASPGSSSDPLLGVWPGLAGRPRISHTARDWLTKLYLRAAGAGITTVPTSLSAAVPAGVRLLAVQGAPWSDGGWCSPACPAPRHRWSGNWHARCARRPRACNR
jgi:DNA-binding transcriptional LysR family regulator